ncbi:hypothetical protein BDK51DRAFT_21511, partial [Blyttiomyces helicus]
MSKTAQDYILRVRAGTSSDASKFATVAVNDEFRPLLLDSEHFSGYLVVRVLNFSGMTPDSKKPLHAPSSNYFHGRNRRYSIMIQGRFKKAWNGDDVIFGLDFDSKVRMPTGAGLGLKIAKWLDPALDADLYADKPWIFSPLVSAMNSMGVAPADAVPSDAAPAKSDTPADPLLGKWSYHSHMVPEDATLLFTDRASAPSLTAYEKRKKFFADPKNRRAVTFSPELVYCMDFYDAYFDFNNIALKLPGFSINAIKYWDGQPLQFRCRTRDRSVVFFSVTFEMQE